MSVSLANISANRKVITASTIGGRGYARRVTGNPLSTIDTEHHHTSDDSVKRALKKKQEIAPHPAPLPKRLIRPWHRRFVWRLWPIRPFQRPLVLLELSIRAFHWRFGCKWAIRGASDRAFAFRPALQRPLHRPLVSHAMGGEGRSTSVCQPNGR